MVEIGTVDWYVKITTYDSQNINFSNLKCINNSLVQTRDDFITNTNNNVLKLKFTSNNNANIKIYYDVKYGYYKDGCLVTTSNSILDQEFTLCPNFPCSYVTHPNMMMGDYSGTITFYLSDNKYN